LAESVRDVVAESGRPRPTGKILLLTHLRYWGFVFNPVSFYFCLDADGNWETMVAEVSNTPWGQVHCYVVDRARATASERDAESVELSEKQLHVSPFLTMNYGYRWDIRCVADRLVMHIENVPQPDPTESHPEHGSADAVGRGALPVATSPAVGAPPVSAGRAFNVTMSLQRRPVTRGWRWLALARFPWMTASVVWGIYWQAWRLWWKRVPYVPHPGLRETGQRIAFGDRDHASVST
jgi:hypothetical protein